MKLFRFLALTLMVVALMVMATDATSAAGAPGQAVMTLSTSPSLDSKGHAIKGQLLIVVKLASADGKPLGNETVSFFESVNFAGANREAALGSAVTDSTGVAAIAYQPAQTGSHTLVARFAGDATAGQAVTTSAVKVTNVVPLFPEAPLPLGFVRHWLGFAVLAVVVAVWVFLLGLLARTVVGIRSSGVVAAVPSEVPEFVRTSEGD